MKALGLVSGQVGAAVWWQASTVGAIGIVVGIPCGVAVGQVVWRAFATNLGAVPDAVVPVWLIAALGAGVLVVANLLAIGPAVAAARSKTAGQLLRTSWWPATRTDTHSRSRTKCGCRSGSAC
jgi:putative ABC transport system permease protein